MRERESKGFVWWCSREKNMEWGVLLHVCVPPLSPTTSWVEFLILVVIHCTRKWGVEKVIKLREKPLVDRINCL